MQRKHQIQSYLVLFLLPLTGCVSTHKPQNSHLVNPEVPHQVPTVVSPPAPVQPAVCEANNTDKVVKEQSLIESSFMDQNCDAVMEHARTLQGVSTGIAIENEPPLVQAAVYSCDAKAGLSDPNRLKQAIVNLKSISLRYPIINEAWLHNTIADFYSALGDKDNAILEKKQARDLLLAQQQDISSLNLEILKLDPTDTSASNTGGQPQLPNSTANQTVDQIITSATQLINNDSPEQAIAMLDTIPAEQKSESTKRLRKEAVNNLVTNLRFKVRALFVRSTEQTGQAKKDSLQQCEQILKGIIQNYPDYQDMPAVQNNLKQVQRELSKV